MCDMSGVTLLSLWPLTSTQKFRMHLWWNSYIPWLRLNLFYYITTPPTTRPANFLECLGTASCFPNLKTLISALHHMLSTGKIPYKALYHSLFPGRALYWALFGTSCFVYHKRHLSKRAFSPLLPTLMQLQVCTEIFTVPHITVVTTV